MNKLIIKVTLNPNNPVEAELLKILQDKKNKAGYLKMAAFHFWKILGKTEPDGQPILQENAHMETNIDIDFSKTFNDF